MICLHLEIPEKFVCLVLQDGFRVVHVPFVCMVKFKLLAQLQVDHLPHTVMSSLIFIWRFIIIIYSLELADGRSSEFE